MRLAALVAGLCWGLMAFGLGARAYGTGIWGGVLASPLIGLGVAALLQARFEASTTRGRWLLALGGLYLGATLFGVAVGATDALTGSAARGVVEVVLQAVAGTWWGITLTGFLLFLWPLAYLTHLVLEWIGDRPLPGRT